MRGLKRHKRQRSNHHCYVASFTDAWIETFFEVSALMFFVSHLLQMRGLKQIDENGKRIPFVASFTDAWIETVFKSKSNLFSIVASFTDAWIETDSRYCNVEGDGSRIFYRCVD